MGVVYLADTNIVSELGKKRPHSNVIRLWQENYNQIGISSVTWHELWAGIQLDRSPIRQQRNRHLLHNIKQNIMILPYDETAAHIHALERARLIRLGLTPPHVDGQIAAVALANDLTMVTRNTSNFHFFQDLRLENWFEG